MASFTDYTEILSFAGQLANAAWTAIKPHFRNLSHVDNKLGAGFDPVTEADRNAETAMRALIEQVYPSDGILGEEFPEKPTTTGRTWVLDPIDGTRAFVAGLPVWTTLIALTDETGAPLIGVIDQPVLSERYLGWPGGAALEQGGMRIPLKVSDCLTLGDATISTTDAFILTPGEQESWTQVRTTARIIRYGLDAYAYARLAAGSIDLVAESGLAPWDAAALIPVIRGAGGLACDWSGAPAMPGGQLVCASSEALMEEALAVLKPSAKPYAR